MANKTMLITGVSSGLGKALAEEGLYQGWRIVGTLRQEVDRQNFEAIKPGQAIGRILARRHGHRGRTESHSRCRDGDWTRGRARQ